MTRCGTIDPDALVASLLSLGDCTAEALGTGGWQGLTGSALFASLLTAFLTILVAWQGYRLLGEPEAVSPRDAVLVLVKIGFVIALATSWPAYDRLIYRVATQGPEELAAEIVAPSGVQTGSLAVRLQNAYDAIRVAPDDVVPVRPSAPAAGEAEFSSREAASNPDQAEIESRRFHADMMLVVSAGTWVAARIVLALGPLAILFALFQTTSGVTLGWLRALGAAALATIAIPLSSAIQLQALLGPVTEAARRNEAEIVGLAPIVWSFALLTLALLVAIWRLTGGLQQRVALNPVFKLAYPGDSTQTDASHVRPARAIAVERSAPPAPGGTRTQMVARALEERTRTLSVAHVDRAPARMAGTATGPLPRTDRSAGSRTMLLADAGRRSAQNRRVSAPQSPVPDPA